MPIRKCIREAKSGKLIAANLKEKERKMKRLFLCSIPAVFFCLMLLLLSVPAMAGMEIQITTDSVNHYFPVVSGGKIVYMVDRNNNGKRDICVYDLATQTENQITTTGSAEGIPSISGDKIVWTDTRNYPWHDIYMYDLKTQTESHVTYYYPWVRILMYPKISGDKIVWIDLVNRGIVVYDIATKIQEFINVSDLNYLQIDIVGNNLVYTFWDYKTMPYFQNQLHLYNLTTKIDAQISTGFAWVSDPVLSGNKIVYSGRPNSMDYIVSMHDLATSVETVLTTADYVAIEAAISGDNIIWLEYGVPYGIHLYNITTKIKIRITGDSANPAWPMISGDKIVYADQRSGKFQIYLYELENPNVQPVANPGPAQTVHVGNVVTLDGSGSTDPDGNYPLSYAWTLVSAPQGSTVTINNLASVSPTFPANVSGDYVLSLIVTDSKGSSSQLVQVKISTTNTPPVADAGQDQFVTTIGSLVTLDGSKSFDVDGDPITHQWYEVSKPQGSNAVLSDSTVAKPTFIADVHGNYIFSEIVSDGWSTSSPAQVTIGFNNIKPVANAGNNHTVVVGTAVNLIGIQSFDANGDALTYKWSLATVPQGSQVNLTSTNTSATGFTADLAGQYVASLTVNDGFVDSDPSNVSIMVISYQTATTEQLTETITAINTIPANLFNNPNNKNALTNKINAVLGNIDARNYAIAVSQLQNDILGKTNGCAISGAPDKNDWITTESKNPTSAEIQAACAAQSQIYPLIMRAISYLSNLP